MANAINEALLMPKAERRMRHDQLLEHVQQNTAQFWAAAFISELRKAINVPDQANPTPLLYSEGVVDKYLTAQKRMILLDYDVRLGFTGRR